MATKFFSSTMGGMAGVTSAAGQMIAVFDACLKDGFGSVTATSLVVASNVATLTVSGGHGFLDYQIIKVEGATPSGLNGEWRITRVNSTVCTFATSGISDQTATGTITAKTAPLGWTKPYSGTNKAAYQGNTVLGTGCLLRMDDSGTAVTRVVGYETMSNVDTGTGKFPTETQLSGGSYFSKSNNTSARAWWLIGDDQGFYWTCQYNGTNWQTSFFGDMRTVYGNPDAYRCMLHGCGAATSPSYISYLSGSTYNQMWIQRNYTLLTDTAAKATLIGPGNYSGGSSQAPALYFIYPPTVAGAGILGVKPVFVGEYQGQIRGAMPGYVALLSDTRTHADFSAGKLLTLYGYSTPVLFMYDYNVGGIGVDLGDWT